MLRIFAEQEKSIHLFNGFQMLVFDVEEWAYLISQVLIRSCGWCMDKGHSFLYAIKMEKLYLGGKKVE